jgi:hypothetical protein
LAIEGFVDSVIDEVSDDVEAAEEGRKTDPEVFWN